MEKEIKNLKGHTIICGYGRNGKQSSLRLNNYKQPFVVIDHNQEALEELEKQEHRNWTKKTLNGKNRKFHQTEENVSDIG